MARGKADWNGAHRHVQWVDRDEWDLRLEENPESLYRIIADAYDVHLRDQEAARGESRSGRRPKPDRVPLEEVLEAVFPTRFSNAPFVIALEVLMDGRSQRMFCKLVPCHQTTLSRLLSGELEPDMAMMERLAAAGGVEPWFFVEWRAKFVGELVSRALLRDPSASVIAISGLRRKAGVG